MNYTVTQAGLVKDNLKKILFDILVKRCTGVSQVMSEVFKVYPGIVNQTDYSSISKGVLFIIICIGHSN